MGIIAPHTYSSLRRRTSIILGLTILSGCAAVNTPLTSDETIHDDTAALLGIPSAELFISNKRVDSGSTYYTAATKDGVIYQCVMEGGTILTMGVHNPPVCKRKGM